MDEPPKKKKKLPAKKKRERKAKATPRAGWREWGALPGLGIEQIKVKLDTGARTSALHAIDIEPFQRDGQRWVRFDVHPKQRDSKLTVHAETPILGTRRVRSSSGHAQTRYVIQTMLRMGGRAWPIQLTLASRDEMGFRMLLGRHGMRRRLVVDPARSYLLGPATPPVAPDREP